MGGDGELAGRPGSAMKKEPAPARPKASGGHACKGMLQKEFAEAKANPKLHGDISILINALRNGDSEEKRETAKIVVLEKLRSAVDYREAVSEFIEAGDGDQAAKGVLTKHFSELLKTGDGLRKIETLADIQNEGVLKELIKCVADTHNPSTLDFIIKASGSCSHPVGAWQAPKVADASNIERVAEFIQSEAAKQSNGDREKILETAKHDLSAKGFATFIPDQRDFVQPTPANPVLQPEPQAIPGEMTCVNVNCHQPVRLDRPIRSEFSGAESGTLIPKHMKTEPDLSLFVQTQETFFKVHGFSSSVLDPVKLFFTPFIDEKNQVKDNGNKEGDEKGSGAGRPSLKVKLVAAKKEKTNTTERDGAGAVIMHSLTQGCGSFKNRALPFRKNTFNVESPLVQEAVAISSKKNKKKRAKKEAWETSRRLNRFGEMEKMKIGSKEKMEIIWKEKTEASHQRDDKENRRKDETESRRRSQRPGPASVRPQKTKQYDQKKRAGRRNHEKAKKSRTAKSVRTKSVGKGRIPELLSRKTKRTEFKHGPKRKEGTGKLKRTEKTVKPGTARTSAIQTQKKKTKNREYRKTKSKKNVMMLLMENRKRKPKNRR